MKKIKDFYAIKPTEGPKQGSFILDTACGNLCILGETPSNDDLCLTELSTGEFVGSTNGYLDSRYEIPSLEAIKQLLLDDPDGDTDELEHFQLLTKKEAVIHMCAELGWDIEDVK